ncbi:MAG: HAMP domain-containing sensor histidine kinase [Acidimicrobiia bacterium]|nr:HAMP domain-containing sensor histidine kinase [Acidimicrobiia bacterium]
MRRQVLWSALAVAAVTLTAGLVAGAAIQRELVRESEAELLRQAEATARLIQTAIRDAVPASDRNETLTVARTLEIARSVGGHDYVEARLIGLSADRPGLAGVNETPVLDSLGSDPPLDRVAETEVAGEPVLAYVRAIPISPRNDPTLLIAIGRSEPLLATNILAKPLLFSLGVGAILAIVLANWVAGQVGRRLDRLETASRAIAAGDFTVRAPADGSDDVARLGGAFNEMAGQLDAARRRERDFLMSVGHDLRTPLTTLRGYAEALDTGQIDPDDLERVGGVLHRQTDRLSRLIDDLTLLARLEAREFTMRPEPVELTAHMRELVDSHRPRADDIRVQLVAELAEVGVVTVDPDRIGQIVGNLVSNGLRYTPEGGTVRVGLTGDDAAVSLSVADTGPGIDPEDLPHVFERLYVAQRYRPVRPEGSGLGLSIVKELTSAIGGTVKVESRLGAGTVVTVDLPRSSGQVASGGSDPAIPLER